LIEVARDGMLSGYDVRFSKNLKTVSELAERGDLLKLWQVHGKMEEDLVKIYLVQIASAV
ncbi:hypothetical protein QYM36_002422, partial [Artemia franciscana]